MKRLAIFVWLLASACAFAHVPRENHFARFQFDAANRLTNTITPLGRETKLTYDTRGLVSTVREPSTQTTTTTTSMTLRDG